MGGGARFGRVLSRVVPFAAPVLLAVALLSGGFDLSRLPGVGAWLPAIGPRFAALFLALALVYRERAVRPVAGVSAWMTLSAMLAPMLAFTVYAVFISGRPAAGLLRAEHLDLVFLLALAFAGFLILRSRREMEVFLLSVIVMVAASDLFRVAMADQPQNFYTSVTVGMLNIVAAFAALYLYLSGRGAAHLVVAALFLVFASLSGAKIAIVAAAMAVIYLLFSQAVRGKVRIVAVILAALSAMAFSAVLVGGPEYLEGRFRRALDVQYGYTEGATCARLFPRMTESRDLSCLAVSDTTERLRLWAHALWVFKQKPLFGAGADAYRVAIPTNYRSQETQYIYEYAYPHNLVLEALAKYGVFGFSLLAASLVFVAYAVSRQAWLRSEVSAFGALIVGMLVISMFSGSIGDFRMIWLFAAAAIAGGEASRSAAPGRGA